MHIIDLAVKCKTATGDGTEIVCMNQDYVVRLTAEDCGTFTNAPIKKLIVKYRRHYHEVDIKEIERDLQVFLGAELPPIEKADYVELGICGKETEDSDPIYTSKSAYYKCVPSALSGAVVKKSDPVLIPLDVTSNGKYLARESNADGFYEVNVNIASKVEESRIVDLQLASGDQTVEPSLSTTVMKSVTVRKPAELIPGNIRDGVTIAGVTGIHKYTSMEKTVYSDGEYVPDAGTDGFSKVVVAVGQSRFDRVLNMHEDIHDLEFRHIYDTKVNVSLSVPGIVQYSDTGSEIVVTALTVGECVVTIEDLDSDGAVINTTYYNVYVLNNNKSPVGTLKIDSPGTYPVGSYLYAEVQLVEPSAEIIGNTLYIRKGSLEE